MWRRYGDVPYTLLVFAVFCLEVLGLGFLTFTFSRRLFGLLPHTQVQGALVGVIALTAASLSMLTGYVLLYHALTRSREQQANQRIEAWTEQWFNAVYGDGALPPVPLTTEALEAGLNLRHLMTGDDGRQLAEALWRTGAAATLLAQLASRRLLDRMEALDGLARARLPTTFAPVIRQVTHPEPVVRLMAARAAARTLAEWSGPGRQEAIDAFARGIGLADLPSGAAAETMLLLEGNAPGVLSRLLTDEATPVSLLRAALDVVGRLRLGEFAYEAAVRISHRDPEVRAAALRALGRAGRVPMRAQDSVVIALMDDTEYVRIQAARAAAFVPAKVAAPALYESLGDRSWWVRRASAESLLRSGKWGIAALKKAARAHPDRFARDMAAQVLMDAQVIRPEEVSRLKAPA